jgi:branched-chain amino acid transport system substrate-binding protein
MNVNLTGRGKMKSKPKGLVWLVVVVLVVGLTATLAWAAGRGVTAKKIKLGLVLVKTGPVAALGLPNGWGLIDYLRYVNERGGINGRKITVIWEDDGFQAPKSVVAVKKLIARDKVLTIMTTGGTNQTIANMHDISRYKIVNIPNAMALEFFKPLNPYIFAMGALYEWQYQVIMDYIKFDLKLKNPRIGVVYTKREYGKKGLYAVRARAKKYGLPIVAELVLPTGAVDASSQVLALKKAGANIVITCDVLPPVITFLKTAQKYDYWPMVFGFNWATDDLIVKACGAAAKNYIGANFVGSWSDNTPGMKLVRMLAKKYGRRPKMTSLYTNGVGTAMIWAEAIKRAGRNLTPDTLKKALETLRNFKTGGVLPPVTYTDKDHAPPRMVMLFKADVKNRRLVPITGWRAPR